MCKDSMIVCSRDNNGARSLVSPASSSESHSRANRISVAIAALSAGFNHSPELAKAILQLSSMFAGFFGLLGSIWTNSDHWGEIVACGRVWKVTHEKTDSRPMLSLTRL